MITQISITVKFETEIETSPPSTMGGSITTRDMLFIQDIKRDMQAVAEKYISDYPSLLKGSFVKATTVVEA